MTKPVAVVVSVRFPRDLAERLFAAAESRGVRTSVVVREAVEAYLNDEIGRAATLDLTVSSADAPITFYIGRSSQGRTLSAPSTFERVGAE